MDLKKTVRKLQRGLAAKGVHVRVNQFQHYSTEKGRMVTKYSVVKEAKEPKKRNQTVCTTYRMIDVVQTMARMLEDAGGDDE